MFPNFFLTWNPSHLLSLNSFPAALIWTTSSPGQSHQWLHTVDRLRPLFLRLAFKTPIFHLYFPHRIINRLLSLLCRCYFCVLTSVPLFTPSPPPYPTVQITSTGHLLCIRHSFHWKNKMVLAFSLSKTNSNPFSLIDWFTHSFKW